MTNPKTVALSELKLAVILPCYNEEGAIEKTIDDFKKFLPDAKIYVYDNNSSDDSVRVARAHGAIVRTEMEQGKGNVVRRMFADIEADAYILCDADDTYPADRAPEMVTTLFADNYDMIVGARQEQEEKAYRRGHRFGNRFLTQCVAWVFGNQFGDILSGYRVFSRRFVKSFPTMTSGFEIETELTIHALTLRMPAVEIDVPYKARPDGTESKLRTYHDGTRILFLIILLFKEYRPFLFFATISLLLATLSIGLSAPIILEFIETGLVPRFPTAILSTGIMLCAVLSFACGILLDSVSRMRIEMKRLRYLTFSSPSA